MPFKLLKQAISYFRQTQCCPFCKSRFNEDSVFIVGTSPGFEEGECVGLFFVICPRCSSNAWMVIKARSITGQMKVPRPVGRKDVAEMHEFLQNWPGGDVKELLFS